MVDDEGPSPDDVRRFSGTTAYCPDCGAEIWDQAEVCPSCGSLLGGETLSRPPVEESFRRRWLVLVVLGAVALLLIIVLRLV